MAGTQVRWHNDTGPTLMGENNREAAALSALGHCAGRES
jgi:hypothetical protein